ncbi:MAG TPA: murein biosynthesis integral membrane protein MurJ [bacterium]
MTEPADLATKASAAHRTGEGASLYRYAGTVTFFTLLSRGLGMVRDLVISHRFGAGAATDAWTQAFRIPDALRFLTAEGSMTIAFVPIYVELRDREGPEAARQFAQQALGLVLATTGLFTVLGIVFAEFITATASPGFASNPEKFQLTVMFTRWMFPYFILVSVVAWAMGILNADKRFAAAAASPMLFNLGIIVAVLTLADRLEVPAFAIAIGVLAGGVGQVLLQIPDLRATGMRLWPSFHWRTPAMRRLFRMMGPGLLGVAVYQVNIIIFAILASFLPTGQIFHLNNASRLSEFVMGLFAFAFAAAGLPALSEHHARGDWEALTRTVRFTLAAVLFTTLPATAGLVAASDPIVAMLFRHGAFTVADVVSTAHTLKLLAVGMPAIAAVRTLIPIFYAMGNAKTPWTIGVATLVVSTTLGWFLIGPLEIGGLALALSLGAWFQVVMLAWALRRKAPLLGAWFPLRSLLQQVAACIVMGLAVGAVAGFGEWSLGPTHLGNWLVFVPLLATGVLLYAGLTLMQREEQSLHWVGLATRALSKARRMLG